MIDGVAEPDSWNWPDDLVEEESMDYVKALREFHGAFGHRAEDKPVARVPDKVRDLRTRLIREEYEETFEAMERGDLVGIADGLADLLYVVFGTAVTYGIPIDRVFEIVHRANMAKLPNCENCHGYSKTGPAYSSDGKLLDCSGGRCLDCNGTGKGPSLRDAGGKTIKPPGWTAPDAAIKRLLETGTAVYP